MPGPVKPLVCIPTTAGTGSEVSAAAVFTDTANHIKVSCLSPFLRPAFAIVDPLFTVSCPPKVTADSGIDALTHAIEAYTAVDNDAFPLPSGERNVSGRNRIAVPWRSVHSCWSEITRSGGATAMTSKPAMAWPWPRRSGAAFSNAGVAWFTRCTPSAARCTFRTAPATGYCCRCDAVQLEADFETIHWWALGSRPGSDKENAEATARSSNSADIIPLRLRDIGVKEEMLPGFAAKAFAIKRLMRVNPRMPQNESEVLEIYRAAW